MLECEDEVLNGIPLNTTNTMSTADKKVTFKNCFLNSTISLEIMCLLLFLSVVITIRQDIGRENNLQYCYKCINGRIQLMYLKGLMLIRQARQKNLIFVIIDVF